MKRNVIWNTIGSLVYSMITILLVTIVKRGDADAANVFTFDFKLAQLLMTIGYFEVRVFQVTDSRNKYSFGDYLGFRIITCMAMMAAACVYYAFSGKSFDGFGLLILICGYKMLDTLADVYEGDYQKAEHIEYSGKSMTIRTVSAAVAFSVVIFITGNVVYAAIALCLSASTVIVIYNPRTRAKCGAQKERPCFNNIFRLFKDTSMLAAGAFLCTYLLNCASYALDLYEQDYNYVFGALFMPASLINLAATMLYKPMLTSWNARYSSDDIKGFLKMFRNFSMAVIVLTLVCIIGGITIGLPLLSLVYKTELGIYERELIVLLIGGGLNALSILIYYGLVVMRIQGKILACYFISLVMTIFIPYFLTDRLGLFGASLSFMIVMLIQTVVFLVLFVYKIRKRQS